MKIKRKLVIGLTTVMIPLMIGALLYYIMCPEVFFVKIIERYLDLNIHIEYRVEQNIVTKFFRNYFFDYIWAFALTNALNLIFESDTMAHLKSCFISVMVGIFLEVSQLIRVVYGTFDVLDILSEILGTVSAIIIIIVIRRKKV